MWHLLDIAQRIRYGNNNVLLHRWLDYRIADQWYFAVAHCIVIFLAALMVAWNVKFASNRMNNLDRLRSVMWTTTGLLIALQQADSIGQPVLVWNLPLSFMVVATGCVVLRRRMNSVTEPLP